MSTWSKLNAVLMEIWSLQDLNTWVHAWVDEDVRWSSSGICDHSLPYICGITEEKTPEIQVVHQRLTVDECRRYNQIYEEILEKSDEEEQATPLWLILLVKTGYVGRAVPDYPIVCPHAAYVVLDIIKSDLRWKLRKYWIHTMALRGVLITCAIAFTGSIMLLVYVLVEAAFLRISQYIPPETIFMAVFL